MLDPPNVPGTYKFAVFGYFTTNPITAGMPTDFTVITAVISAPKCESLSLTTTAPAEMVYIMGYTQVSQILPAFSPIDVLCPITYTV